MVSVGRSIYLPCWLKDYLGNEFFGRIDVEFDRTNVSPDVFANIVYNEPINTLTLRFADLSSGDLQRISRTVDAKHISSSIHSRRFFGLSVAGE